ncbi:MAG: hypothetical protein CMJ32_03550 [Phycisphaerae bacterium]|nr:hypothetical protein [Phycisphaerae bacterium]
MISIPVLMISCSLHASMEAATVTTVDVPQVDRTWIGPGFWANRLQDWEVLDGRIVCNESSRKLPVRTVHLLEHSIGSDDGSATLTVLTGAHDAEKPVDPGFFSGFLVGCGGGHVDHRLSALAHHAPAEDGGTLAIMDGHGIVSFRDFSSGGGGGTWAVAGEVPLEKLPLLAGQVREGDGFDGRKAVPVRLELEIKTVDRRSSMVLRAYIEGESEPISTSSISGLDPGTVDGSIAIVSHLGPVGSSHGAFFEQLAFDGPLVHGDPGRRFGPIFTTMYTLHDGVLKLTAQSAPLGPDDTRTALLQVRTPGGSYRTVDQCEIIPDSWTFPFRVEGLDAENDTQYRVLYDLITKEPGKPTTFIHTGTIRSEPSEDEEFVLAGLTCHKCFTGGIKWNHDSIWFPHAELVDALRWHDPDMAFFSGDQIYEGDLTHAQRYPVDEAMLDYLYKWYRWCWAFDPVLRDRPCVVIPDDHDVYHGNLWGAGGRKAEQTDGLSAQDSGGYKMPPRFVNAVHRTQTSHLPDPFDPTPIEQDISVYYTGMDYGGLSFAILGDRQFKSSPSVMVPEGRCVNGWFQAEGFDPVRSADVPGAVLLGRRQLDFLDQWAVDHADDTWMKVVLSQTLFANLATLPEDATSGSVLPGVKNLPPDVYPGNFKKAADADSNGWPQTGRDNALRLIRRGLAIHLCGDQHLGSTVQYGIDEYEDAGYAFCLPSIANTWPRRWFPPESGANAQEADPPYCGDFLDGFGNRISVRAVSNPVLSGEHPSALYDRAPGYGIVRFDRETRDITFECWPRWVDPASPGADQRMYAGWPITISQYDNCMQAADLWLPTLRVDCEGEPLVRIIEGTDDRVIQAVRIKPGMFQPRVYDDVPHAIEIVMPDGRRILHEDLRPAPSPGEAGDVLMVR